MSAATRTAQAIPGTRQLGAALVAVILAVALVALLAFSQLASTTTQSAPAAGTAPVADHGWSSASSAAASAPVLFDHGWSSASSAAASAPVLFDHGWSSAPSKASIDLGRHRPKTPKAVSPKTMLYTGIPYRTGRAPGIAISGPHGGILYVGIPYPAPGRSDTGIGRSSGLRLAY